jgi:hypothetical protein
MTNLWRLSMDGAREQLSERAVVALIGAPERCQVSAGDRP